MFVSHIILFCTYYILSKCVYSFHFLEAGGPFVGRRYMLNGDHGTVLVFGANGHIAGMQMAVRFFESFFVFFICIFFSG